MDTIFNLLNPGGICLFIAGNKLKFIEPHFKLPFLSYMPSKFGNLYIKLMKRDGEFYQKHLSFFKLKSDVEKPDGLNAEVPGVNSPFVELSKIALVDGSESPM